jgi:CrcB protein
MHIVYVGVLGLIGIYSRYFLDTYIAQKYSFALSTIIANLLGCVLIAIIISITPSKISQSTSSYLIIGLCGGLTTFSSYCIQGYNLIQTGQHAKALIYITGSPIIGTLSIYLTIAAINKLSS